MLATCDSEKTGDLINAEIFGSIINPVDTPKTSVTSQSKMHISACIEGLIGLSLFATYRIAFNKLIRIFPEASSPKEALRTSLLSL